MQRLATGLLVCAIAAMGCGGSTTSITPPPGQTSCQTLSDCGGGNVCINSQCVPVCHSSGDCSGGQVCEEGICLAPACGSDSQCSAGQACINGACKAAISASQVASCEVTPGTAASPVTVRAGQTLQFKAIALDANGHALHFNGFTWSTSAGTIDANSGVLTAAAGAATVTATVTGTAKNCTSSATGYADAAANSLRVTVVNQYTREPIQGADVVIDGSTTATASAADGTVTFPQVGGTTHNVHVFAKGYSYASFIQINTKDLLVPLTPYVSPNLRSGFTEHMCVNQSADAQCPPEGQFQPLSVQGEAVHLAFFGSAVPNSLLDLSVDTLVGPTHPVTVSLGGASKPLPLPYGLVLGVGNNFFGTNDPRFYADAGVRTVWGIGGNLNLTDVARVAGPLLSGSTSNVDVGSLLAQLLPFFSRLQAGAETGVIAPANGTLANPNPTFTNHPVALTTAMRLRVQTPVPALPQLDGKYVDGVIALAGAMNYPMGFVPLGLTAGLSAKDSSNNNTAKVLDPDCVNANGGATQGCATSNLTMKLASPNGGSEGSKMAVALVALNFGGLTPGSTGQVAVSGQVQVLDKVDYVAPPGAAPVVNAPQFLTLPASSSITVTRGATRSINIGAASDARAQIYRFEVENANRLNWNIWTAPGAQQITLPNPQDFDSALVDPLQDVTPSGGTAQPPSARLLAVQLSDSSQTAQKLETFGNSISLDALGTGLAGFTALQVPVH